MTLKDHWDPKWNQLDEFWLLVDYDLEVIKANLYFREWFYMHAGKNALGFKYDLNPSAKYIETVDGWAHFVGQSRYRESWTVYKQKRVDGGMIINIDREDMGLDATMMQKRLEEAQKKNPDRLLVNPNPPKL